MIAKSYFKKIYI